MICQLRSRLFLVSCAISFFFADNARHLKFPTKKSSSATSTFYLVAGLVFFQLRQQLVRNLTCGFLWQSANLPGSLQQFKLLHTWKQVVQIYTFLVVFLCSSLQTSSSSHCLLPQTWNKSPPENFLQKKLKKKGSNFLSLNTLTMRWVQSSQLAPDWSVSKFTLF